MKPTFFQTKPKFATRHDRITVPGTVFDLEVYIFDGLKTLIIIKDRPDNEGMSVTNNIERVVAAVKKAYLVSIPRDKLLIVAVDTYNEAAIIRNETVSTGFEYVSENDLNKFKTGEFST